MTDQDQQKIPLGYKLTDVGVIPQDWEVEKIGNMIEIIGGSQPPKFTFVYNYKPGYIRLIQIRDYKSDKFITYIPEYLAQKKCTKEDIMIGRYGPPVFQIVRGIEGAYNVALMKAVPKNGYKKEYIWHFLRQSTLLEFVEGLSQRSSGQTGVDLLALNELKTGVPKSKLEQQSIATALTDIDNLISELDTLIIKKQAIKNGTMQQLLTGKKRLQGFSGEREEKALGEIGIVTGAGIDKKINQNEEPVRLLNYLDVYKRDFIYSKELNHYVTAPRSKIIQCSVQKGDVFFTPSSELQNDIAHSAIAMQNMDNVVYSYHVIRLRIEKDRDVLFRAYIFKTKFFYEQAEKFAEGSGKRYVISLRKFRELKVYYPVDIKEQQAIAQFLSDMDNDIQNTITQRDKYKSLKQGMMQQLLTGKIRLKITA